MRTWAYIYEPQFRQLLAAVATATATLAALLSIISIMQLSDSYFQQHINQTQNELMLNSDAILDNSEEVLYSMHYYNSTQAQILDEIDNLYDLIGIFQQNNGDNLQEVENTINGFQNKYQEMQNETLALQNSTFQLLSHYNTTAQAHLQYLRDINSTLSQIKELLQEYLQQAVTKSNFLEVINSEVTSFTAASLDTAAFEGDACEYDPLGVGPIVCEGTEQEVVEITEIEFE